MSSSWPLVYADLLQIGNLESNVAICTLWTKRDRARELLDPKKYAVIGNLYRSAGISPIIRNVYGNPLIRYIVLWGNDLSESGQALVYFMKYGIDNEHHIVHATGEIEKDIDQGAIETFRRSIELIDLRGETPQTLQHIVNNLEQRSPFSQRREFPISKPPTLSVWPSEKSGFRVEDRSVARTWLRALRTIMTFGWYKKTRYGNTNQLREILNLNAIIKDDDPDKPELPAYLSISIDQLNDYYSQILTAKSIEGTSYTYGTRLRDHNGVDQIQLMVDLIRARPDSKKLFASTWQVDVDSAAAMNGDSPCLTQINGAIVENKLFMTAHFRSQDIFSAWPLNTFSILKLQKYIADEVGMPMGLTTIVTHSAYINAWNWSGASQIIAENYIPNIHPQTELDPRGYVIVSTKNGTIHVQYFSPIHELIDIIEGTSASAIGIEIVRRGWTGDPGHALYLGRELEKAELSIRLGIPYIQDRQISLHAYDSSR